jgi:NTE family protein
MRKSPFTKTALVLQGGGALGAYQAGVYEALSEAGYEPDWVAGISIGGINAAIIAGNKPEDRLQRLTEFWRRITSMMVAQPMPEIGERGHQFFNRTSALISVLFGSPGFFKPRLPPALLQPQGAPGALSFYDTAPLRDTLARLIDFDLINNGHAPRLSLGAVNVRTANFVYFDSAYRTIKLDHVMASAALPPGFPPVEIEGEHFWDGGLVSNTPLSYVLEEGPKQDTLVFQVDLFSALGPMPRDLFEVEERRKDISYSSRTRLNTDNFRHKHQLRRAIGDLYEHLPADVKQRPDMQALRALGEHHAVSIVHLIYRRKNYEIDSKDYEFSRASMQDHWRSGVEDTHHTLHHQLWLGPVADDEGVRVFDLASTCHGSDPAASDAQTRKCKAASAPRG